MQKRYRDAARSLVDEMDDLLSYGVEEMGDALSVNSSTKAAFRSTVSAIEGISKFIEEQNTGMTGSLFRKFKSLEQHLAIDYVNSFKVMLSLRTIA